MILEHKEFTPNSHMFVVYFDTSYEWIMKISTQSPQSKRFIKLLSDWAEGENGESIHYWNNYTVSVNEKAQEPGYYTYTLRHLLDKEDMFTIVVNGNIAGIKITKTLVGVFDIMKQIILNSEVK